MRKYNDEIAQQIARAAEQAQYLHDQLTRYAEQQERGSSRGGEAISTITSAFSNMGIVHIAQQMEESAKYKDEK